MIPFVAPKGPQYGALFSKAGTPFQSLGDLSSMVLDFSLKFQAIWANPAPLKPLLISVQGNLNFPHRPWCMGSGLLTVDLKTPIGPKWP
ncbi:hypothetical protein O181_052217 [Austropuccinia psidii MF-1]|uniref:Uncharacterized protein n=1 Tax=Austropuccinia psidii MF-1 TaxID=1389203 RepID=A0A9Q3HQA6_9BASI|nr:hypothetical protein [Austropuccinia psidii MF-1]